MSNSKADKQYIIIGAGGHAAVIADILLQSGCSIRGFLDDAVAVGTEVLGTKVIGKLDFCMDNKDCLFIIGVGDNGIRKEISQSYPLDYGVATHPSAIIGLQVSIGRGTVIMAGCVINSRTAIGEHCIINTNASIDHDSVVGDFTHISPGAVLGGTVIVGSNSHIGIGSCVKNNINISDDVIVGAGASVVKDINTSGTYVGVPVRRVNA